ncbi:MAG: hypothetical protein ABW166_06590 [Sedimenticola sp.]
MHYFGFLGSDQEQVLAKVDTILDDILRAHEKKKYELFTRHLGSKQRENITEQQFLGAAQETNKRLGSYKSRRFLAGLRRGDLPMLLWAANYSNSEDDIMISLVLDQQGDNVVVNWFWVE